MRAAPRRAAWLATAALAASAPWAGPASASGASGSISGHVSMDAAAACVLVLDSSGQSVANAATEGGSYTVEGVPAGSWAVEFVPDEGCLGAETVDAFQYYPGAPTQASATLVAVAAGQDTAGIDATLQPGAIVQGSVASSTGQALPGACAVLEDTSGVPVVRQPTDTEGKYRIAQLPAGRFVVQFLDDGCVGRAPLYASAYFGGTTLAEASSILLRAGLLANPIDGILGPLPPGGGPAPGGKPTTGTSAAPAGGTGTPSAGHKGVPRPLLSLIGGRGGRYTVDRKHRLHLTLRCAPSACAVTIGVNRVRRHGTRLVAGAPVGSRSVTVRPGKTRTLLIALRGVHAGLLWVSVHGRDGSVLLGAVIAVRWPSRVGAGG